MKAIFKGNKFAIQWTIKDAVTSLPFDFTGMFVEYILYSDNYKGRIVGATTNINKMQAEIPANILPVGVYNIICKYRNSINEGHCIYRNAFQITRNPEFIGCDNVVVIESFSAPLKLENMDINYLGHFTSSDLLIDCNQPSWALVGKLNEAEPWFFYTEDAIPAGSQYGWNNMSEILGTYNLTEDKVSIYDFNLITEYNVSRNHTHTERKFSPHWGATTKYYPEYEEYSPCKIYEKDERVNMPGYTENSFIALHQTSDAPYEIINETSEFSFSEAINLVPEEFRFPGIRMTYVKKDTHQAETWFYKGGSWENKNSWVKPEGNVTINNSPDEEDIASIGDNAPVLKLKDKVYNPQTFSGLGRTYLRKNMINSKNVLTQAMFINDDGSVRSNTRYIIQYDYDLNGATITIPDGCVLVFQGGSLSNGTVTGNKTVIEAGVNKIFNTDINISGTWNITEAYAEWFGAVGDGISDDRLHIQKSIDSFDIVKLQNRVYYIASYTDGNICIKIGDGKNLIGIKRFDGDAFKKATIKLANINVMGNNAIAIACGAMCELRDFAIKGNNSPMDFGTTNLCCGITNIGTMNYKVKIEDVDVETFYYGVNIATWMSEFIRVGAKACKYGIAIHAHGSLSTHGVMDLNNPYAIVSEMTSNVLSQCYCNDCFINGYYLYGVIYSSIISCAADGCGTFVRANWSGYPEDMAKMTDSNTHHPYYFNKCRVVNMSACGSEGCVKLIQTESCWNMTIDGIMVYMLQQEDFFYTNWIKSTNDNAVTLKNIRYFTTPWRLDTKFINVSGGAIELDNIVSGDYDTYVSRRLINVTNNASVVLLFFDEPEKIEITTLKDPGTNETFYNMYQLGNALRGFLMCKSNPKNITYNVDVTGYGIAVQSQSVKGWKDNLYLYGTSKETEKSNIHILPSTNYGSTFENFNSIVFKDLWMYLHSADYTLDYIFKFIDCPSVVFENVKFSNTNISYITKWFESSGNTNIVFKNCTLPDSSVVEYAIWGGSDWVKFSSPTVS